ncbi:hypothetical protein NF27_DL00010, partial [Candidatus Jidaibacter acanthamoeba]
MKRNKGRRNSYGKIKYKVNNWKEYKQSLKNRGSLIVWISKDIEKLWYFSKGNICKRGRLTF